MNATKNRAVTGLFIIVAVFFSLLILFAVFMMRSFDKMGQTSFGSSIKTGSGKNLSSEEIAVIEVEGVIFDAQDTLDHLQEAFDDDNIKGIIMRVNSPGGAVGPVQEVYEEIERISKTKPVWSSFGLVSASGGYYIGAATSKIYANAGSLTGSIGVIMETMDLSELMNFAKVKSEVMKAGKFKDIGHYGRPMKPEERAIMDATLADVHEQFKEDILKTRKDKIKGDLNELAQGQVFSGRQALKAGLIDGIGGLSIVANDFQKFLKLKGKPNLNYLRKKKKFSLMDVVDSLEEAMTPLKWKTQNYGKVLFYLHQ